MRVKKHYIFYEMNLNVLSISVYAVNASWYIYMKRYKDETCECCNRKKVMQCCEITKRKITLTNYGTIKKCERSVNKKKTYKKSKLIWNKPITGQIKYTTNVRGFTP